MAENKGKKYTISIIIPLLLIVAAAFFIVINAGKKQTVYRPQAIESGYIDAQAVYNSNKTYGILKKEIKEYAARVNKELAGQLAREHNEAKRAQLKRLAKKEIELYAETLLQDIDKDVDDAINEVAENKNLKRVYISGSVRQNGKNMTQAVITELNMTVMQRISGYFYEPKEEQKQQPKYEQQFNFDSYPMAKVPEQGVTKEASGSLAMKKKKGSIVADTQLQPKDKEERFVWKQKELKTAVKKAPATKEAEKYSKTQYANTGKIKLPSGKAEAIAQGYKYVLSNSIAYIQAKNAALTELEISASNPAGKTIVTAKTATKQFSTGINTGIKPTGVIASRPSQITAAHVSAIFNSVADSYSFATALAFIQAKNAALTELQMSAPKPAEKTCVSAKTVTKQPKTGIKPTDTIASRPSEITAAQIAALLNAVSDKTYAAVAKFQEYTPIVIENTQGAMAMLSVKCGKMWQKIYPFAAAAKTQPVQIYRSVTDATTENIGIAQQPVTQETAKEEKAVEAAAPVQQTADKPTDIKQTQPEQPKAEKAEQKPEKQSETEPVKTAENTAGKAALNVVSKPVTIQVAACLNKSGADDAIKKLRRKHIPARVDGIVKDGRQWWCVRITAVGSAQVNGYKQQLAAMGYIGVLVR